MIGKLAEPRYCDQHSIARFYCANDPHARNIPTVCRRVPLFGGQNAALIERSRVFDHLGDIGEALAALGPATTAAKDVRDRPHVGARGFSEFAVSQRIADTDVHGSRAEICDSLFNYAIKNDCQLQKCEHAGRPGPD